MVSISLLLLLSGHRGTLPTVVVIFLRSFFPLFFVLVDVNVGFDAILFRHCYQFT